MDGKELSWNPALDAAADALIARAVDEDCVRDDISSAVSVEQSLACDAEYR